MKTLPAIIAVVLPALIAGCATSPPSSCLPPPGSRSALLKPDADLVTVSPLTSASPGHPSALPEAR